MLLNRTFLLLFGETVDPLVQALHGRIKRVDLVLFVHVSCDLDAIFRLSNAKFDVLADIVEVLHLICQFDHLGH